MSRRLEIDAVVNQDRAKARKISGHGNVVDDPEMVQVWRRLVRMRLKTAAKEVLSGYEAAMKPFQKGMSVSAAGGTGASGATAGGATEVAAAFNKLKKNRPFVSVRRGPKGFVR